MRRLLAWVTLSTCVACGGPNASTSERRPSKGPLQAPTPAPKPTSAPAGSKQAAASPEVAALLGDFVRVRDARNFALGTEQVPFVGATVQREGLPFPRSKFTRVLGFALGFDFQRDHSNLDSDVHCTGAVAADGTLCPSVVLPGTELSERQVERLLALRESSSDRDRSQGCLRTAKHAFVFFDEKGGPTAEIIVDFDCGQWSLSRGRTSAVQMDGLLELCKELRLPVCAPRDSAPLRAANERYAAEHMATDPTGSPRQKWFAPAPLPAATQHKPLRALARAEQRLLCGWNAQHTARMFGFTWRASFRLPGDDQERWARALRWPECTTQFPECTETVEDVLPCMDVAQSGNPWFVPEPGADQARKSLLTQCSKLRACIWGFETHTGPDEPPASPARSAGRADSP